MSKAFCREQYACPACGAEIEVVRYEDGSRANLKLIALGESDE